MIPRDPGARMRALLFVVGGLAALALGIAEAVAIASGESILWTISKVSWQATNENPVFAVLPFGLFMFVAGHLWFPKGKCAACGCKGWAADAGSRAELAGKVMRAVRLFNAETRPGDVPDTQDVMRRAGFPVPVEA